jgi:endonuclease/exonuclease/phosphatase family metal-dependent hydrolase
MQRRGSRSDANRLEEIDTSTSTMKQSDAETIRIVAYNFLSGGSSRRTGHWTRLTRSLAPTVIFGQECREPAHCPAETFRPAPHDSLLWEPVAGRRWGSALLARSVPVTPLPLPDFAGWVVGGQVNTMLANGRPLRMFSIHGPAGDRGYVRTMHLILDRIAPLAQGADLMLGGDFNVVVGYRQPREKLKVSHAERELLERLGQEFGLLSCWQAANPNRALAQTLRWTANRRAPYHCDGIFVPAAWLDRLVSCRVVRGASWDALSDHSPVVAEFRVHSIEA